MKCAPLETCRAGHNGFWSESNALTILAGLEQDSYLVMIAKEGDEQIARSALKYETEIQVSTTLEELVA